MSKPETKNNFYRFEIIIPVFIVLVFIFVTRLSGLGEHPILVFTDISWIIASFFAGLRCWIAGKQYTGRLRYGWFSFAAGCFTWSLGLCYWAYKEIIVQQATPFPALSDIGFTLMAPLFLLGFYYFKSSLSHKKLKALDISQFGIIASSVLLLHLIVFIEPILNSKESTLYILTAINYPVIYMSVLLYALVNYRSRSAAIPALIYNFILLSFFVQAMVDSVYAYSLLGKSYAVGNYIDVFWVLAFCLTYSAALLSPVYKETTITTESDSLVNNFDNAISSFSLFILAVFVWIFLGEFDFQYLKYIAPVLAFLIFFIAMNQLLSFYQEKKLYQKLIDNEKSFNADLEVKVKERTEQLDNEIQRHKETTQQLEEAQRIGKIGHWKWYIENNQIFWSDEIFAIFSVSKIPADNITTYSTFLDYVHPDDRKTVEMAIRHSLDGIADYSIDHRIILPNQTEKWVHEEAVVHYKNGNEAEPEFMMGTVQDITHQKEYETSLVRSKIDAEIANNAKTEFLSKMSHELRTPLNAILGFSQLLDIDKNLDADQKMHVEEILRGGKHLLHLIDDLLNISRIETGRIDIDFEELNIAEVISQTLHFTQQQASEKNITVNYDNSDCDCFIMADVTKFKQILINLMTNAIKYNKQNGLVAITCKATDEVCEIHVSDTGMGIPEDKLESIYNKFSRVDGVTTGIDGLGIGLYIAKNFIDAMHGTIRVKSVLNEGTIFTVSFPRHYK